MGAGVHNNWPLALRDTSIENTIQGKLITYRPKRGLRNMVIVKKKNQSRSYNLWGKGMFIDIYV